MGIEDAIGKITADRAVIIGPARLKWALLVVYDADCAFCTLCIRILRAADLLTLVTYRPGHFDPGQRIQSVTLDGQTWEGMDVMVQVAARSVLLWPLLPLVVLGRLLFRHRPYDFVADRRYKIMGGTCRMP